MAYISRNLTALTQKYFRVCSQYLLEKGLLVRTPYVSMPKSVEFIKNNSYLGGIALNPFSQKRTLDTVEVAHLHKAIESNLSGLQMILGFGQFLNRRLFKGNILIRISCKCTK